jgi:hypothetical protein
MESEEELRAILAHEIAHFVLDHQIIKINEEISRVEKAKFWAGLSVVTASIIDINLAHKKENHIFGLLTYGTLLTSSIISNDVLHKLKLSFSKDQEYAADKCAIEVLKFIGESPDALASALNRLKQYHLSQGDYYSLSSGTSHPTLTERINKYGNFSSYTSIDYNKIFSLVNTENAWLQYNLKHFREGEKILLKNIASNIAVEDDYFLISLIYLHLYNSEEKLIQALNYINIAINLKVNPIIELFKIQSIIYNKLSKQEEAIMSMKAYVTHLEYLITDHKNNDCINKTKLVVLNDEIKWARKMIYKFENL